MGIVVDDELKVNKHVQTAVAKASQTLDINKFSVHSRSSKVMTKLCKGLLQPLLEFGMCVTTPLNKGDQQKINYVQRWATKAVDKCKNKLKLPILVYRCHRGDVIMTCKLLNADSSFKIHFSLMNHPEQVGMVRGFPGRG